MKVITGLKIAISVFLLTTAYSAFADPCYIKTCFPQHYDSCNQSRDCYNSYNYQSSCSDSCNQGYVHVYHDSGVVYHRQSVRGSAEMSEYAWVPSP